MPEITAQLLTAPYNYAVVQLPTRAFPGVVVQGDSLNMLLSMLTQAKDSMGRGELGDAQNWLREVIDILESAQTGYEAACSANGRSLPYCRSE